MLRQCGFTGLDRDRDGVPCEIICGPMPRQDAAAAPLPRCPMS
jgi:hypothetical protein